MKFNYVDTKVLESKMTNPVFEFMKLCPNIIQRERFASVAHLGYVLWGTFSTVTFILVQVYAKETLNRTLRWT